MLSVTFYYDKVTTFMYLFLSSDTDILTLLVEHSFALKCSIKPQRGCIFCTIESTLNGKVEREVIQHPRLKGYLRSKNIETSFSFIVYTLYSNDIGIFQIIDYI